MNSIELEDLIRSASKIPTPGERIACLSSALLGIPYRSGTLIGSASKPEEFVPSCEALDCFTFLDHVEAMRRSVDYASYLENLKQVRYRQGFVSFHHRRHFFTDWIEQADHIREVTVEIGQGAVVRMMKILNRKADGSCWLPGIPSVKREIRFIPVDSLNGSVFSRFLAGDYVGLYAPAEGLDVTHAGIVIRQPDGSLLYRHASSMPHVMKVVDQKFEEYACSRPGLVVFRPV